MRRRAIALGFALCALALSGADAASCEPEALLPGGEIARAGDIVAFFADPTDRYPHGVLGDALEAATLTIGAKGRCARIEAGPDRVFEDLTPRLVDVTGDGAVEAIVVASDADRGARLELWSSEDEPRLIAATPHIGTRFRWLAPIGAADFDGDGRVEIAYVDRPHLAKTMRIVELDGDALVERAAARGFSNHRIGEAFVTGGVRRCSDRPEMILADGEWRHVVAARFDGARIESEAIAPFSPGAIARALACE